MAEIQAVRIFLNRNDIVAYEWLNMTEADTAVPVSAPPKSDKTAVVSDDFGTSGDVRIEGSIDPDKVIFNDLHDPQGNVIAFIATDIETVLENVMFIRPRIAAGTSVSVDVRILMRQLQHGVTSHQGDKIWLRRIGPRPGRRLRNGTTSLSPWEARGRSSRT